MCFHIKILYFACPLCQYVRLSSAVIINYNVTQNLRNSFINAAVTHDSSRYKFMIIAIDI